MNDMSAVPAALADISGHQSWNLLKRYTHIKPESVMEKMR